MSIGSVSFCSSVPKFNLTPKAPVGVIPIYPRAMPQEIVVTKFDSEKKEFNLTLALEGTFDSERFYKIKEDGSCEYSTCWKHNARTYEAGVFSDVYKEAMASYEKNAGVIPDEDARALGEKIKEIEKASK